MPSNWRRILSIGRGAIERALIARLREADFAVDIATSGEDAIERARQGRYPICCFTDERSKDALGADTLWQLRELQPRAAFVVVSATMCAVPTISVTDNQQEYLICPASLDDIVLLARRIASVQAVEVLDVVKASRRLPGMVEAAAQLPARNPLLIHGNRGSEVELIARAIHDHRSGDPGRFVHIKCASLTEAALDGLLAALRAAIPATVRPSSAEEYRGTIFLDQVETLSPHLQESLLGRLRLEGYAATGILAGTEVDLEENVLEGKFLEELYYHLCAFQLRIAPLRARREDLRLFIGCALTRVSEEIGHEAQITREARRNLMDYLWPGNFQELARAMERAIATRPSALLTEEDFSFLVNRPSDERAVAVPEHFTFRDMERVMINATLGRTRGNIKEAASLLGINRSTLYDKMKKYNLTR